MENSQERTETQATSLSERVAYLEGRMEMSQTMRDVRDALTHVQIAVWGLAAAMLTGMGAMPSR